MAAKAAAKKTELRQNFKGVHDLRRQSELTPSSRGSSRQGASIVGQIAAGRQRSEPSNALPVISRSPRRTPATPPSAVPRNANRNMPTRTPVVAAADGGGLFGSPQQGAAALDGFLPPILLSPKDATTLAPIDKASSSNVTTRATKPKVSANRLLTRNKTLPKPLKSKQRA